MVELIVVLFKNLLSVPIRSGNNNDLTFHIELLKQFKQHDVLNALVFMAQKFESEFSRRLAFHFLEIFYFIYKHYSPIDFFKNSSRVDF